MKKKIVVITGVTKGLGHALVREFAKLGWKIAGSGRSTKIIQELQTTYGPEHLFSTVDITNETAVAEWANAVSAELGAPSILINNAALINEPNVLWEVPFSEFTDIMKTNVTGTFIVLRSFIPIMMRQGKGLIVNVSSGWGVEGGERFAPYCASKFAIEGLTQSLAEELPQGLTAVTLDPGVINTDMLHKAFSDAANNYPNAEQRAKVIVPFLLNVNVKDNGKHLIAPH